MVVSLFLWCGNLALPESAVILSSGVSHQCPLLMLWHFGHTLTCQSAKNSQKLSPRQGREQYAAGTKALVCSHILLHFRAPSQALGHQCVNLCHALLEEHTNFQSCSCLVGLATIVISAMHLATGGYS